MEGDEAQKQNLCLETGGIISKTSTQILKDSPEIDLQESGQKRHTDTVPGSPTKKHLLIISQKTALYTAYHTTDKRNYSQHSFNDKVNTAHGLKLTLSSIQGI
jgi:hypothetical protein